MLQFEEGMLLCKEAYTWCFPNCTRFERRIFIPLPDVQARTRMFELNIGNTPNTLVTTDYRTLGEMTEGYGATVNLLDWSNSDRLQVFRI